MASVKKLHQQIEWLEKYLEYYTKKYPSHERYINKIALKLNEKKETLAQMS